MFAKQWSLKPLIGEGVAKANSAASSDWPVSEGPHRRWSSPEQQGRKLRPLSLPGKGRGRRNHGWLASLAAGRIHSLTCADPDILKRQAAG